MRNEIKGLLEGLKRVEIKVQGYLNSVTLDNEEREERLASELESIREAIEALENIE